MGFLQAEGVKFLEKRGIIKFICDSLALGVMRLFNKDDDI